MPENDHKTLQAVLGCLGYLVTLPLSWLLTGWAASILWGWFVVPLTQWTALSIWQAAGVVFTIRTLTTRAHYKHHDEDNLKAVIIALVSPPLYVAMGWLLLQAVQAWG